MELGARCGTWVGDASVMSGVDRVDFSSQNLKIDRSVKSVTLKDINIPGTGYSYFFIFKITFLAAKKDWKFRHV